jgi:hypothetical protein
VLGFEGGSGCTWGFGSSLAKIASIGGVGASSLTQYNPIDQPSAKMRLSDPPEGYEWATRSLLGPSSRLGLSLIQGAQSGFCVLRGFFVERVF